MANSLFKKPCELEVAPTIKCLIYGQPGTGKSSLALSAPRPVLFDFDGGIHRVNGAWQCPTLQVHSWDEVTEALKEDLSDFDTIVIDTVGKMLDYMSEHIIRTDPTKAMRDGSLSLNGYGVRKQMFINFISKVGTMGKHIMFVAHEREEKDGENKVIRPEIGGSSAADLIKELDLVGYVQKIGSNSNIFWTPTEKFYAKNTCNLASTMSIPNLIDAQGKIVGQNNMMSKIFTSYIEFLKVQKERMADYDGLMDIINVTVDAVEDASTANQAVEKLSTLQEIWDSKTKASILLNNKCLSLGLKFNKISGQYEPAA